MNLVANVTADDVQGKCFVVYHDLRTNSVDTATLPSHTFYFSEVRSSRFNSHLLCDNCLLFQAYVSHNGTFSIPPPHILSLYNKRKVSLMTCTLSLMWIYIYSVFLL